MLHRAIADNSQLGSGTDLLKEISLRCPERYDLVVDVVSDVGSPQPGNPGPLAPVTSDLLFVHSEIRFVGSDGAAAAKHDSRHPPDFGVTGDVK